MYGGWWPRPQRAAARSIAETAKNRGILRCTGGGMRQSLIFRAVRRALVSFSQTISVGITNSPGILMRYRRKSGSGRRASRAFRAGGGQRRREQALEARRGRRSGRRRAQEAAQVLSAPAHKEPMQGVRGGEHLPAPAQEEHMQGVRGGEHLPAPAHQEHMQGVRGGEHLPAPAHQEHMQGLP